MPAARRLRPRVAGGRRNPHQGGINNKDRNFTRSSLREFIRRADEWLEDYLKRLDEGDVADGATGGGARTKNLAEKIAALSEKRGRYQAMLAQLERTGEDQISLTDPDSCAMAAHTKVAVGYNIQVAVDAKNKLIVEQAVTNQVVDMGLLTQTAEPARQVLGVGAPDIAQAQLWSHFQPPPRTSPATQPIIAPRTSSGSSVAEDNAIVKVAEDCVALAIFVMNTAIVAIMGLALHRLPLAKPARRTGILCIG